MRDGGVATLPLAARRAATVHVSLMRCTAFHNAAGQPAGAHPCRGGGPQRQSHTATQQPADSCLLACLCCVRRWRASSLATGHGRMPASTSSTWWCSSTSSTSSRGGSSTSTAARQRRRGRGSGAPCHQGHRGHQVGAGEGRREVDGLFHRRRSLDGVGSWARGHGCCWHRPALPVRPPAAKERSADGGVGLGWVLGRDARVRPVRSAGGPVLEKGQVD